MNKKIGIICAGDTELEPFLPEIQNDIITDQAMLHFHEGQISQIPVVALYSGVCKVNAAIAAQILSDRFHVDVILNAGTAGGIEETLQIFDTVVSTQTAYHDVDEDILTEFHPWLPSVYFDADADLLRMARQAAESPNIKHRVCFGKIVTGEQFIKDHKRAQIKKQFSPLAVDMESAGIAHVCHVNRIPFLAIRTITDTADHAGIEHFEQNCEKASEISKDFVLQLFEKLRIGL